MTGLLVRRGAWLAGIGALLLASPAMAKPVDQGPGPLVPKAPPQDAPQEPELPSGKARVVLRCIVMVDARVDKCVVAQESPPGHGLGDAALGMARQIKISPENFSHDIVGQEVDIPLSFSRDEEMADMPSGNTMPM